MRKTLIWILALFFCSFFQEWTKPEHFENQNAPHKNEADKRSQRPWPLISDHLNPKSIHPQAQIHILVNLSKNVFSVFCLIYSYRATAPLVVIGRIQYLYKFWYLSQYNDTKVLLELLQLVFFFFIDIGDLFYENVKYLFS